MQGAIGSAHGHFFGDLSPALQQSLLDHAVARRYRDGQVIHRRGDRSRGLSIVRSGAVRLSNIGRDGREVTLATLVPGESFGEFTVFAGLPRQFDLTARGETVIENINSRRFDALLNASPGLARHVIRHLAQRLHQALELLDDERRLTLPVRLAKRLRQWSELSGGAGDIAATQQELADELAVSRVALSAAVRQLASDGLITAGYGRIRIRDSAKLENWISEQSQLAPAGSFTETL
jgi:CRP-like cAMP-binding protein